MNVIINSTLYKLIERFFYCGNLIITIIPVALEVVKYPDAIKKLFQDFNLEDFSNLSSGMLVFFSIYRFLTVFIGKIDFSLNGNSKLNKFIKLISVIYMGVNFSIWGFYAVASFLGNTNEIAASLYVLIIGGYFFYYPTGLVLFEVCRIIDFESHRKSLKFDQQSVKV